MFKSVDARPDFPKLEEEVLKYWQKNKVFEKSLEKNKGKGPFVFFEGPPTANGRPGLHHVEARSFKDVILRFQTMLGKFVLRKAGWDTHGLPVELEVEKELQISGKREIENLVKGDNRSSIEKFNKLCRESVWKYKNEWEAFTSRMGFWIDMSSPYVTYENSYIESVWSILKTFWEKKVLGQPLVYLGHKVLPFCARCGTALSSHEVAQGYTKVEENSIYVRFLLNEKKIETKNKNGHPEVVRLDKPTYILSWTTTPWTLPGNVALAVGEEIEYSLASVGKENYIVASALAEEVLGPKFSVLEKIPGKYLAELSYQPLYDVSELRSETAFKLYAADFVNLVEGTGIVHTAVMYGEDDYNLGSAVNLPKFHTVTEEGKFIASLPGLAGMGVKDPETEKLIIDYLKRKKLLFGQKKYTHDYPFCWRCNTPLLYYARDSWFVRMSALRENLQKNNRQINWVPEHIRDGRFGEWLAEVKDWAISRDRYWGTPLPFWKCGKCGKFDCIGSIAELTEKSVGAGFSRPSSEAGEQARPLLDLHRPYIDEIKFKCEKCGGEMTRVPEVLDCWFDAGAMPYAQWHYPFENKERIECGSQTRKDASTRPAQVGLAQDDTPAACQYPADYISEAVDQTRGWFYTLLAIATALGHDTPPYKNVICLGHVLDERGQKMSKSKGNVVEPMELMKKYGADIVRWYMYAVNQPGESKLFAESELTKMQRRVQLIFWNVYNYFVTYAQARNWQFSVELSDPQHSDPNILDQWINVRLQLLVNSMTENLTAYNVFRAARNLEDFISDLSTWYLRRSRGRSEPGFFSTLFHCLMHTAKLSAPFMPFFAEAIYSNLRTPGFAESVHLTDWPEVRDLTDAEKKMLRNMKEIRQIVETVLAWRKANNLKVRQPLADLLIKTENIELKNYSFLLAEELNFVSIQITPAIPKVSEKFVFIPALPGKTPEIYLNSEISEELKIQGLARELERAIQEFRKESGLKVGQQVSLYYETVSEKVYESFEYFDQNKTYVARVVGARQKVDFEKEFNLEGHRVWIGLKVDH
ncbi:MAG: isoleucine--tRNA ligase [Patescibacteria group bacterium]